MFLSEAQFRICLLCMFTGVDYLLCATNSASAETVTLVWLNIFQQNWIRANP